MPFFDRRPRRVVPASVISGLADFGRAVIAGSSVLDPPFGWDYMLPAMTALSAQLDQAIGELYDAALAAVDRPMAMVGAYRLMFEWDNSLQDERFLALREVYKNLMRDRYDQLIADVAVPPRDHAPQVEDLQPGQYRLVARTGPPPDGNEFYAERRADWSYAIFSVRCKSIDDRTRVRSEEDHLGPFGTLPDLLRALGADFGLRPYWAGEDLEPYFPRRRR